jgi:putative chitinase
VITPAILEQAWGIRHDRALKFADALDNAMLHYEINTPVRAAAFLAQIGHESGRGLYVREMWGPTAAQKRYEGRLDLGNTEPGDGFRFRGRGLIQITGRDNYRRVAAALGIDCVEHPELLEQPCAAALSAAWFWAENECNALADAGATTLITRRVNGGLNGLQERTELYRRALEVLNAPKD